MKKTKPPRPKKMSKPDRLTGPEAWLSKNALAIWHAVEPLHARLEAADREWGVDRLPRLVSPPTARKWGEAVARFELARESQDLEEITKWAAVCITSQCQAP